MTDNKIKQIKYLTFEKEELEINISNLRSQIAYNNFQIERYNKQMLNITKAQFNYIVANTEYLTKLLTQYKNDLIDITSTINELKGGR